MILFFVRRNVRFTLGLLSFLIFSGSPLNAVPLKASFYKDRPKLVLVVVFDQFRADYLTRFQSRFGAAKKAGGEVGGFQYLMNQGAYFPQAKYDLLQNMTGPGHSIILSGSYPYQSGVALNNWFDSESNQSVYCAEDGSHKTVQAAADDAHLGTSPKNFTGTTLGDELKNSGADSRVVSIALKDRSAIFMGGHRADLALWMDSKGMRWVSSNFYLPNGIVPDWITELNQKIAEQKGTKLQWNVEGKATGLSLSDPKATPDKKTKEGFGLSFPHTYQAGTPTSLATPYGLDLTESAVENAFRQFQLGTHKNTDLLAVSFSSHDYMGHQFGPNSLEMEEMTVAEDKVLAKLLNFVQKNVPGGLKNVTIVLTADHGIPPSPDWLKENRIPAGRLDEKKLLEAVNQALDKRLGEAGKEKWISAMKEGNFYLNPKALLHKKVERSVAEEETKSFLRTQDWVFQVFSLSDYRARRLPPGTLERQILKSYYPGRSGDVVAIPKPFYMMGEDTVSHQTGFNYDRTVPLIFAGPHFQSGIYASSAEIVDIAPTLSFVLGVLPPALSEGKILHDILSP
jgi:predicted AlkP superfamily pyrophosphatase or phosphodiesterase